MPDNDKPSGCFLFSNSRIMGCIHLISMMISLTLTLAIIAALVVFGPEIAQIRQLHFQVKKALAISVTKDFPITATMNHDLPVRLNTEIPVDFPVTSLLRIPLKETFQIPLNDTIPVHIDKPLRVRDTIQVRATLPLDTMITTKVMGVPMTIPVKGSIPLDIAVPLDQEIAIEGDILVNLQKPLPVTIDQMVEAPVNFNFHGEIPLHTEIIAPVKAAMHCNINLPGDLPIIMDLDLTAQDFMDGARVGGKKIFGD